MQPVAALCKPQAVIYDRKWHRECDSHVCKAMDCGCGGVRCEACWRISTMTESPRTEGPFVFLKHP